MNRLRALRSVHRPLAAVVHAQLPPSGWRPLLSGRPRLVCFLKNAKTVYELARQLGAEAEVVNVGERVNHWMDVIRQDMVNLDACFEGTQHDPLWQASDLAERNPCNSDLSFLACAWLTGLEELVGPPRPIVFVVEHSGLGLSLLREAGRRGYSTVWRHPSILAQTLPALAGVWRAMRLFTGGLTRRFHFLRDFLRTKSALRHNGFSLPCPGRRDRMVAVWAGASTFPPDSPLQEDTYYGPLPGYLRDNGEKPLYLAIALKWVDSFTKIASCARSSGEEILFPEQCLSPLDALYDCLRTLFWKPRITRPLVLAGHDATWLLRDALREERSKTRQAFALQFLRVGPRLAALGVHLGGLLHLYENQPWEKLLRMGLCISHPGMRSTGYMHSPFSKNYISFLPSRKDLDADNMPDRLITPGRAWQNIMRAEGIPANRLTEGPSLRLGHCFACPAAPDPLHSPRMLGADADNSRNSPTVLVAGSMDPHELEDAITYLLTGTFQSMPELHALVKPHPKAAADELRRLHANPLPAGATFTSKPMEELLPAVDAVLHSGSTVALEALCLGKPALFIGSPAWLDMDKLDWFPDAGRTIRTPDELVSAMRDITTESSAVRGERMSRGRDILQGLFNPISSESLNVFSQNWNRS